MVWLKPVSGSRFFSVPHTSLFYVHMISDYAVYCNTFFYADLTNFAQFGYATCENRRLLFVSGGLTYFIQAVFCRSYSNGSASKDFCNYMQDTAIHVHYRIPLFHQRLLLSFPSDLRWNDYSVPQLPYPRH